MQHGTTSIYRHSLNVAYTSLWMMERWQIRLEPKSLVRGALLHDYFLYDWHQKDSSHRLHGFRHPNANITLPLYAKAMSLPLDEVIRMVASVNPAIKDLNGFIILATIPFNVLKVGLNYIVGQLLFVRLRAAKIVPKAV